MARRALHQRVAHVLSLSWLTGPIFTKELRVSARRRRNYLLRTLYAVGMLAFVVMVWLAVVPRATRYPSAAYRIVHMSEAGKYIVMTLVWFQYCTAGLLAVVLPSTAISDEVYHRTLGVLMTTPVTALQIVAGKMLAKLSQLLLLLAVSVPVLAVVRVFGGVPWEYVVAGLCLTLTTAMFFASVSMLLSVFNRHAYLVILEALFALGFVFALLPAGVFWFLDKATRMRDSQILSLLSAVNPMISLAGLTEDLGWPSGMNWHWQVCSLFMLVASAGVLAICVALVRYVALRQMVGSGGSSADAPVLVPMPPGYVPAPASALDPAPAAAPPPHPMRLAPPLPVVRRAAVGIRRIVGHPLIWLELRRPVFRRPLWRWLVPVGMLLVLLVTYAIVAAENEFDDKDTHLAYVAIFTYLGLLTTLVLAATSITSEKESRCWPLLLMTTMSCPTIALAKAAGVLRRSLPIWMLLAGHVAVFTLFGVINPVVSLFLAMIVTYSMIFLIGSGMYFGSIFRRTTTAVVFNLGLVIVLWVVVPLLAELGREIHRPFRNTFIRRATVRGNPVVQCIAVTVRASGYRYRHADSIRDYGCNWPHGNTDLADTTAILLATTIAYSAVGVLLTWRATVRFRRKVF